MASTLQIILQSKHQILKYYFLKSFQIIWGWQLIPGYDVKLEYWKPIMFKIIFASSLNPL